MAEYRSGRSRDRDPIPWDACWSLARSDAYSAKRTPLLRGIVALVLAVGLIVVADLFLRDPYSAWPPSRSCSPLL